VEAQALGISVDSVPCLVAWADSLGGIQYPLLSDFYPHGAVAAQYGVLRAEGYSERALFIVDKEGILRYVDVHDIGNQPDNEVLLAELRKIDPHASTSVPDEPRPVELPGGGIVMYCTSWCPACHRARNFFNERGLVYTEVDIDKTPGSKARLRKLTGGTLTTPTFDIDGEIVVDFKREQLERVLSLI
jgi:glutaredoxin